MSHHVVVRDDQEAALVVANGRACSPELLGQLLEWSPLVVALDGAFDRLMALGVYAPDQEATDLQKALQWLWDRGHRSAQVLWGNGPGPDHFFGHLHALATAPAGMSVGMLEEESRTFRVPKEFSKCYGQGERLSLMPFPSAFSVETENLLFSLKGEDLHAGHRIGISNQVLQNGRVRISYTDGCLLMTEPLRL
jgi:thiamine pyrophosphokinase